MGGVSGAAKEVADGARESLRPASADPYAAVRPPIARVPRRLRLALLVLRRAGARFTAHHGLSWAASIAFYVSLSVPPLLIALTDLAGSLLGSEELRASIIDQVTQLVPGQAEVLRDVVPERSHGPGLPTLVSVLLLLVFGSRALGTLVEVINLMWRRVEDATWLRRQRLRLVLLLGVGALFALGIAGRSVVDGTEGAERAGSLAGSTSGLLLPTLLVGAGLLLTYRLAPGVRVRLRSALIGAVLGALLLRAAQAAFSWALEHGVRGEGAYGPLASIAVLLTWALVASAIVLLGAEVVATLERRQIPRGDALTDADRR